MALDSGGSANSEFIRREYNTIELQVRTTIYTKKYFNKEKPLIYLVWAFDCRLGKQVKVKYGVHTAKI